MSAHACFSIHTYILLTESKPLGDKYSYGKHGIDSRLFKKQLLILCTSVLQIHHR